MNNVKVIFLNGLLALSIGTGAILGGCAHLGYRETTGRYVDDSVITLDIKAKLAANKAIRSLPISIKTFKGSVELTGFVDKTAQQDIAGNIARSVNGVTDVHNRLVVRGHKG